MSTLTYIKNFIKDKNVASITPTSTFGIKKVNGKIDFSNSKVIIEYGPATGVFTRFLLEHMKSDTKLILIETNYNFVSILRKSFKDTRVKIFNDSAENVNKILKDCGESGADCIVSGIPFSFLSRNVKIKILESSYAVLNKGGKLLAYQTFFQTDNQLKKYLERYFKTVWYEYELMNIPPLKIYEAIK
ncbi:class I SAM-dependent methyltransferase [Desulfolucanica intricata]|uniref:class I SAM-dependent methyltransferase n=1 Tax=Desulfolucanica intricata TaxID=1285191 RepID=UPI0008333406|nr:rRNA adenine N-6-methyltransferase family protein [Desulfolucanica intricata]